MKIDMISYFIWNRNGLFYILFYYVILCFYNIYTHFFQIPFPVKQQYDYIIIKLDFTANIGTYLHLVFNDNWFIIN